jgi:hypothetical protein
MLLRDEAIGLCEAFGRQRVRTKISCQALDGELGEFFVRAFGVMRTSCTASFEPFALLRAPVLHMLHA